MKGKKGSTYLPFSTSYLSTQCTMEVQKGQWEDICELAAVCLIKFLLLGLNCSKGSISRQVLRLFEAPQELLLLFPRFQEFLSISVKVFDFS